MDSAPGLARAAAMNWSSVRYGLVWRTARAIGVQLKEDHRPQLARLVPGILQQRLEDDVRQVEADEQIAVGPRVRDFRPAERAAATDLVVDHDRLVEILLEERLLPPRFTIRLAAGIERDQIRQLAARVVRGAAAAGRDRGERENAQDGAHRSAHRSVASLDRTHKE